MATTADLAIERLLTQLTEAQAQNSDILTKLSATRNEATKLKIGPPTEFTGKSEETRRFIQQCESHFTADTRATDDQKIECALSYMKGEYPSMFVDEVRALRLLIPKEKLETLVTYATIGVTSSRSLERFSRKKMHKQKPRPNLCISDREIDPQTSINSSSNDIRQTPNSTKSP